MDQYNVDIRFPRSDGQNTDLVVISGLAENVEEAKDHILNLAEEYVSSSEWIKIWEQTEQ